MSQSLKTTVAIVGGGLSGLTAANILNSQNVDFVLIEAEDRLGGRVKTENKKGFLLDKGFQVFLPSYPEAKKLLNYSALNLKAFDAGCWIRENNAWQPFFDPLRHPVKGLQSLFSGVASLLEKVDLGFYKFQAMSQTAPIVTTKSKSTLLKLKEDGISDNVIQKFFKPFFSGVFLETELTTDSGLFEFLFQQFSQSKATVPQLGMEEIPKQLAANLAQNKIYTSHPIQSIQPTAENSYTLTTTNALSIQAQYVIFATPATVINQVLPQANIQVPQMNAVWTLYYSCNELPLKTSALMLSSEKGPINHLCFMDQVSPKYAPQGQHLVSISVVNQSIDTDKDSLIREVETQLTEWFGSTVKNWQLLDAYCINNALPRYTSDNLVKVDEINLPTNIYIAGDWLENPSINGAMLSGRKAAEKVLQSL